MIRLKQKKKKNASMSKRFLFGENSSSNLRFDLSKKSTPIADRFRTIGQSLQSASSIDQQSTSKIDRNDFSSRRFYEHQRDISPASFIDKDSTKNLRQSTKSIRENVIHFKDQLIKSELDSHASSDQLSSLIYSRQQTFDRTESECSIDPDMIPNRSVSSKDLLHWKKSFDQSERQRLQITDEYQNLMKKFDEKETKIQQLTNELKEFQDENEKFERQNVKLQQDLRLALEKLEEMTCQAERFAEECQQTQKDLSNVEQKFDEFQIQSQENQKQLTMKIRKMEKDLERQKDEGNQLIEKNQELNKENENLRTQNLTFRERISEIESESNRIKVEFQQIEEENQRNENELIQLRSIRSTNENELKKLKSTLNEFESHLNKSRQRCSTIDRQKIEVQHLFDEETRKCEHFQKKFEENQIEIEQMKKTIDEIEDDRQNLRRKLDEVERDRDQLFSNYSKVKSTLFEMEKDFDDAKNQFERFQIESKRHFDSLRIEQENLVEKLRIQLNNERSQREIYQKHEIDLKKELEKFQEKSFQDEQNLIEKQTNIDVFNKDLQEKNDLIKDFETKTNRLTVELTNLKVRSAKRIRESQNFYQTIFNDLTFCVENLSKSSSRSSFIETRPSHENDDEDESDFWSNQIKRILLWLKQEIDQREKHENELRRDLEQLRLDSELDRKYFVTEIAKREILLNDLTDRQKLEEKTLVNRIKFFSTQLLPIDPNRTSFHSEIDFDEERALIKENDRIDEGFQHIDSISHCQSFGFQSMIDLVKRDLHTAKLQLSN